MSLDNRTCDYLSYSNKMGDRNGNENNERVWSLEGDNVCTFIGFDYVSCIYIVN